MILPRLLDKNLKEICRLHPSSLMVALNLTPISTATMTISDDIDEIQPEMHQFVEIFRGTESLGVFRISEISSAYGEKTISLEHAITSLEDDVTEGNATLTGNLHTILQALMECQSVAHWQLGNVEDTRDDYSITVDRSMCLQTLLEAAKQAKNCYLHFDQSTYPWTISLLKLPDAITSECRISRNIEDVTVSLDDSVLCTRVYSSLLPNGYLDADTISKWGVVAKTIQLDDGTEAGVAEKNIQVATEYLEENKNPAVSIKISAIRLAEITGEQLDKFSVGGMCRVALPEMDITRDERIVSMTYSDLVSAPERVSLVLSSGKQNAGIAIAEIARTTRQITRTVAEQHKHITETDTELKLHADRITGVARELSLKADNADVTALGTRVSTAEVAINDQGVRLNAAETVTDELTSQVTELETTVTVEADGLRQSIQEGDNTIAELKSTVNGLEHWATDADGNISTLTNTVRGMQSKVETADGRIVTLSNTADGLVETITEQGVELSGFRVLADEISSTVQDTNGNVGSLIVKSDSVTAKVNAAGQQLNTLAVTADGISATITKQGEEMSSLKVRLDEISQAVKDTNGNMGSLVVRSDSIRGKLEDAEGNIKALQELTEDHYATIMGDVEEVDGKVSTITGSTLWQRRDNITAAVGKMYVGEDGKLHIVDGSGLVVDEGSSSMGVYTEGNLTAGVLVRKLNNGTTSTKIKADIINLDGYVTMEDFKALEGEVDNLWSDQLIVKGLSADNVAAGTGDFDELVFGTIGGKNAENFVLDITNPKYYTRTYLNVNFATMAWVRDHFVMKT